MRTNDLRYLLTRKDSDGVSLLDDYNKLSFAEVADRLSPNMREPEVIETIVYLFRRLAEGGGYDEGRPDENL